MAVGAAQHIQLAGRRWPRASYLAGLVFVLSLAMYFFTLPPGLLWGGGDFATLQTMAYLGTVDTSWGALAHPLWVTLAHLFTLLPFNEIAWRANFASAIFAAAAAAIVFLTALRLTRSHPAALVGTAAIVVSHTFWTYAVMPKIYSLNALLLAGCTLLIVEWRDRRQDRYLYLFALLYGFSFLNHLVMVTVAAGFAAFILITMWPERKPSRIGRRLLLAIVAFAFGLLPCAVFAHQGEGSGTVDSTVLAFLKGLPYGLAHPGALVTAIGLAVGLGLYQFPITAFVGLAGLRALWLRDRAIGAFVILAALGTLAFMLSALDPAAGNIYVWNLPYYLQAYVPFTLAVAEGARVLWPRCTSFLRRASLLAGMLLLPVLLYALAPAAAGIFVPALPNVRALPGRDNLTFVLSPWKQQETGASEMGRRVLGALPQDSVLFADYGIWSVVRYLQVVDKMRPDVDLVLIQGGPIEGKRGPQVSIIQEYHGKPDLFLADTNSYYELDDIKRQFDVVPSGPIFRLKLR